MRKPQYVEVKTMNQKFYNANNNPHIYESVAQYTVHCWIIYLTQICGQAAVSDIK